MPLEITSQEPRAEYTVGGTPSTGPFTINWQFFALTDIRVFVGGEEILTGFTVAGTAVEGGYSGGSVSLDDAVSNTDVALLGAVPITRTTNFQSSGVFPIPTLNTQFNKLFVILKQILVALSRSISMPESEGAVAPLPAAAARAGKALVFDENGAPGVSEDDYINQVAAAEAQVALAAEQVTLAAEQAGIAEDHAEGADQARILAEAALAATLTAYDNFDDRYLGAKASDPAVDNDGNALVAGALYFKTGVGMMIYTGSAWEAAYVAGTDYARKDQNLADLTNKAAAFAEIKQTGTESVTGALKLANSAATVTGTNTTDATHAAGVKAAIDAGIATALAGSIASAISAAVAAIPAPGMVLVESKSGAGAASLDFTAGITATYDEYELHFSLDLSADAAVDLLASINGGSSFLTSYEFVHSYQASGGSTTTASHDTYGNVYTGANSDSKIRLAYGGQAADGDTAHTTVTGVIRILNANSTTKYKRVHYDMTWTPANVSDGKVTMAKGAGNILTTSAVNALRIAVDAGNIASGSWARLYGLKK